jgi:hypothetical protein
MCISFPLSKSSRQPTPSSFSLSSRLWRRGCDIFACCVEAVVLSSLRSCQQLWSRSLSQLLDFDCSLLCESCLCLRKKVYARRAGKIKGASGLINAWHLAKRGWRYMAVRHKIMSRARCAHTMVYMRAGEKFPGEAEGKISFGGIFVRLLRNATHHRTTPVHFLMLFQTQN